MSEACTSLHSRDLARMSTEVFYQGTHGCMRDAGTVLCSRPRGAAALVSPRRLSQDATMATLPVSIRNDARVRLASNASKRLGTNRSSSLPKTSGHSAPTAALSTFPVRQSNFSRSSRSRPVPKLHVWRGNSRRDPPHQSRNGTPPGRTKPATCSRLPPCDVPSDPREIVGPWAKPLPRNGKGGRREVELH